ncbi:MAG: cysteine peptidase family C39 domain-containing protein [Trueperaceae bacterium]
MRLVAALLVVASLLAWPTVEGGRAAHAAQAPLPLPHRAWIPQAHPHGCGAALLATMLAAFGLPGDQHALLSEEPPGPDGIHLAAFARMAERHGLPGRWIRVPDHRASDAPFVAHLARPVGHLVWVLERVGAWHLVLDPDAGVALWHDDRLRRRATGLRFVLDRTVPDAATVDAAVAAGRPAARGEDRP